MIPAAGLGTRFLPATKVIPKEMLPIAGRPLIQFAVEEAAASGLEKVILVLRKGKEAIIEHFRPDAGLEEALEKQGVDQETADAIRSLTGLIDVGTAWQEFPRGLADAIRAARPLISEEPFAVILPDALIDSPVPCTAQLMACYEANPGCVVATQPVDPSEVERFGIIDVSLPPSGQNGNRAMRVKGLVEHPRPGTVTSGYGIFGRYILEPGIFASIEGTRPGVNGELQLTDALVTYLASGPVYAYQFDGIHYDAGSKLGFVEATLGYALKDPEIAPILRRRLASLAWTTTAPPV